MIRRDQSSELFAKIASARKGLHANPGLHSAVPREETLNTQDFLAQHLSCESG